MYKNPRRDPVYEKKGSKIVSFLKMFTYEKGRHFYNGGVRRTIFFYE